MNAHNHYTGSCLHRVKLRKRNCSSHVGARFKQTLSMILMKEIVECWID